MFRWERRDKKLQKKKNRMKISGKSVFNIERLIGKRSKDIKKFSRRKNARG
jgi:hypothetical protein